MLKLKKSLGQNFLSDNNIIKKIIGLDNLKNRNIIEIGPGSGKLTEFIIKEKPKKLVLIEKDRRFCKLLKDKFVDHKKFIEIHNKDILDFTFKENFLKDAIIFGNLPYNISTQILAKFICIKNGHHSLKNYFYVSKRSC